MTSLYKQQIRLIGEVHDVVKAGYEVFFKQDEHTYRKIKKICLVSPTNEGESYKYVELEFFDTETLIECIYTLDVDKINKFTFAVMAPNSVASDDQE